jgi:hypothetical protein
MKPAASSNWATPAVCLALALLTFFQLPGHTWLQQDSQIYVPILEHQRDPTLLRNDILVQHSHIAYTLYDEIAVGLGRLTGLGFREVLAAQQVATRALGVWGLLMLAEALGLPFLSAIGVAAICSLGAVIVGPAVLTTEYEPTPRAFAVPLLVCSMGLAARRRYLAAGIAAAVAFFYHPPTTLPFLCGFALLARRARLSAGIPVAVAAAILLVAAHGQTHPSLFGLLPPAQESLQRMRAAYVFISTWPAATIVRHLLIFTALAAACARFWRTMSRELRVFLLLVPALAVLSMPLSWLLLEHARWALIPQIQPMRALLFGTLAMQFLTAAAGAAARHRPESALWFTLAFLPSIPSPLAPALGAATALLPTRWRPVAAVAAFFAIPTIGGVVNYPRLHTPELAQLSDWARASTSKDAVFLFPDSGRDLAPGIFRSEALRAVYVDWKGGGQVNYLRDFGYDWWFRWQQTIGRGFQPADVPRYAALGINYIVLHHRRVDPPEFENRSYAVYRLSSSKPCCQ